MAYLLRTIRKIFFWNYARTTWQWDILCVLILIFIFLAPKRWFENGERHRLQRQQSPISALQLRWQTIDK